LDGKVGTAGVFHGDDGACRGQGHGDDDDEREDRPGNLDTHVFVELGGHGAARFPVHDDGVEHHPEHPYENHGTDNQQHPVDPHDILCDLCHPLVEVELIDPWASWHVLALCTGNACH